MLAIVVPKLGLFSAIIRKTFAAAVGSFAATMLAASTTADALLAATISITSAAAVGSFAATIVRISGLFVTISGKSA